MIIEGTLTVPAGREDTWRHLSDLSALAPLLPGCEAIEPAGEDAFRVVAQAKVGPIKARLAGTLTRLEARPPESMRLRVEGRDGLTASHVRAAIGFTLSALGDDRTEVHYSADVLISGRLGTIGQGIMRETVAAMLEEFVRRLTARITGAPIEGTGLGTLSMRAAARSLKGGVSSLLHRGQS